MTMIGKYDIHGVFLSSMVLTLLLRVATFFRTG